jgi:S1-C subfamily serine protease
VIRAAALLAVVGCAATMPAPRPPEVSAWRHPRAVVVALDCSTGGKNGSGVAIGADRVLTAAHVVRCDGTARVAVDGRPAHVVRVWTERDTALVATEAPAAPLRIGLRPAPGDRVCAATATPKFSWSCGYVRAVGLVTCADGFCYDLTIEVEIRRGNSGSGLFNARGELVGLVTGNSPADPDGRPSYAISLPAALTE